MPTPWVTPEEYLASVTPAEAAVIRTYYDRVAELLPGIELGKSYGMAACLYRGKGVLSVIATKAGFSMFPYSGSVVPVLADRLADFSMSKGGVRFTADHLIPDDVLVDMIELRRAEIDAKLGPA